MCVFMPLFIRSYGLSGDFMWPEGGLPEAYPKPALGFRVGASPKS